MLRCCLIPLFLVFSVYLALAQPKANINPLRTTPLLSGSFGELRATHFHSGIDLRTGGQEALPVLCVNDGVLVRVFVSAVGYGKALYIKHDDGTLSVYAHLQRFSPAIDSLVKSFQYKNENFYVDENVEDYGLTFCQGDVIAYSGNSGSSGGPHLHLEYRNVETEILLNPLQYLPIKDQIAPKPRAVYLYRISENGCVYRKKRVQPKRVEGVGNKYVCGSVSIEAGKIGLGVYATDAMNDSWSKLGLYKLDLEVNGEIYFSYTADSCSFDSRRLVNEIKDFDAYAGNKETVYKTFGNYMERIPGVTLRNKGCYELAEDERAEVRLRLADYQGNHSVVEFSLLGLKKGEELKGNDILHYDSSYVLLAGNYSMQLGAEALFHSLPRVEKTERITLDDGMLLDLFVASERESPLMRSVRLSVQGEWDERALIYQLTEKKELVSLPTFKEPGEMYTLVACLGKYTVVTDTILPEIKYLGIFKNEIQFEISDHLSGIDTYRVEVNGTWSLFEYDAKNKLLYGSLKEPAFRKGVKNTLVVMVKDKAGNRNELKIEI
ncbi:peptidoglycan DD-metalloendopeptidase family protein [Odoribacter sp. OttesenSCG-928-A06]|nr:peptidoglycan DD-metalloendopeptidase family protein [Odoribacter sp. OttesenSCG-928-A06]